MPRPKRFRRIGIEPEVVYFRPERVKTKNGNILTVDEWEAIRLVDLLQLKQSDAAKRMDVSQPTLHRLLRSGRKKISDSIINGKPINIQNVNYIMIDQIRGGGFGGPPTTCVCPKCGYKEEKIRGVPCINKKCPKCGTQMMRGD